MYIYMGGPVWDLPRALSAPPPPVLSPSDSAVSAALASPAHVLTVEHLVSQFH